MTWHIKAESLEELERDGEKSTAVACVAPLELRDMRKLCFPLCASANCAGAIARRAAHSYTEAAAAGAGIDVAIALLVGVVHTVRDHIISGHALSSLVIVGSTLVGSTRVH